MSALFCFIQMCDLRQIRQYLTEEADIFVANAFESCHLDYYNSLFRSLSRFNIHKLQCIQKTLARIVINMIDTHRHLLFSKDSIGYELNFAAFSKQPLWVISFFTVLIPAVLVLFCLFIVVNMAQDKILHTKDFGDSSILRICT